MRTDELDFDLPAGPDRPDAVRKIDPIPGFCITFAPAGEIHHRVFSDLADLAAAMRLLVFNDSKVIPAPFQL